MKKILIAYGSGGYKQSLRRIGKEARKLGIFSKVILYTKKDLPPYILSSPLMAYARGDGYWAWKPYLIWNTMQRFPNDIIVYVDCGCTLYPKIEEWNNWFQILNEYDTLVFRYHLDHTYPWQKSLNCESIGTNWTKESLLRYFDPLFGDRSWSEQGQIWAGLVLARRQSKLIKMWMDITLMRPDLILDCYGNEIVGQSESFKEHRHDQSLLSGLSYYWENKDRVVKIIPETAESSKYAAVVASRIHSEPKIPLKCKLARLLKRILGERNYRRILFWK